MKYSIFLFNDSYIRKPNPGNFGKCDKKFVQHNLFVQLKKSETRNNGVINYLLIERGSMNGRKVDFLSIKAIYKYSSFLTFTLIRKFTS